MLAEKPWKVEAIVRLGLSIIVCLCLGGVVLAALQYLETDAPRPPAMFALAAIGTVIFALAALIVLRKQWELDRLQRLVLTSVFLFAGTFFSSALAQYASANPAEPTPLTVLRLVVGALSFHGAALLLMNRFLRGHQISWREAFGFTVKWKLALLAGFLGALVFLPVGAILQKVSANAVSQFGLKPKSQEVVELLGRSESKGGLVIMAVIIIILVPLVEEIVFRGILYPAVKRLLSPQAALWGVSVLFAAIHLNLVVFFPLLLLAILLTRFYENTGNLLASITTHCLFNGANFFLYFYSDAISKWLRLSQ